MRQIIRILKLLQMLLHLYYCAGERGRDSQDCSVGRIGMPEEGCQRAVLPVCQLRCCNDGTGIRGNWDAVQHGKRGTPQCPWCWRGRNESAEVNVRGKETNL